MMPLEPVKIPQNVYIEDRIVGPLTLRQIILIALGGGFSYVLYTALLKSYGELSVPVTVLVWLPLVAAAAFALVRINDLSLFRICLLVIERMNKPSVRTFAPRQGIEIRIKATRAPAAPSAKHADATQEIHERKIQELSSLVDQGVPVTEVPVNPDRIAVDGPGVFRDISAS